MKNVLFRILAFALILVTACNTGDKSSKQVEMSKMDQDTSKTTTPIDEDVATVTPYFTSLDGKVSGDLRTMVNHYLHIKNALVNDDSKEAANGGKGMVEGMSKVDKSFFTPEQKKLYETVEDDLKKHAEHIGTNSGKIDHQRDHFSMMSEDVYDLVKAFGGGQTLYHAHCPMYNDNKGALWLSEAIEIKNPYMGSAMPNCGKMEEIIK